MKILCRIVVFSMSVLFFVIGSKLFLPADISAGNTFQEQLFTSEQQKTILPESTGKDVGFVQAEFAYVELNQNAPNQADGKQSLTGAFVKRLYRTGLGREPDAEGLAFWMDVLTTGECSGVQIAYEFLTSQEIQNKNLSSEEYLEKLYNALMDRKSDPTGLAYWKNCMEKGSSKTVVLRQFLLSEEFLKVCTLYGIKRGDPTVFEIHDDNLPLSIQTDPVPAQLPVSNVLIQESDIRDEVLRLVNEYRSQRGAGTLRMDDRLNRAAHTRAGEIIHVFEHYRPDGRDVWTVFTEVGYTYAAGGENIAICGIYATSKDTANHIFNLWKNSPGHEENMRDSMFRDIGVGIVIDESRVYGVQLFGKSK